MVELQPEPSASGLRVRHLPAGTATSQCLACPAQPACLQGLRCLSRLHRVALFSGVLLAVEAGDLRARAGYCARSKRTEGKHCIVGALCEVLVVCRWVCLLLLPSPSEIASHQSSHPILSLASLLSQQPLGASPLPVLGLNGSLR